MKKKKKEKNFSYMELWNVVTESFSCDSYILRLRARVLVNISILSKPVQDHGP